MRILEAEVYKRYNTSSGSNCKLWHERMELPPIVHVEQAHNMVISGLSYSHQVCCIQSPRPFAPTMLTNCEGKLYSFVEVPVETRKHRLVRPGNSIPPRDRFRLRRHIVGSRAASFPCRSGAAGLPFEFADRPDSGESHPGNSASIDR